MEILSTRSKCDERDWLERLCNRNWRSVVFEKRDGSAFVFSVVMILCYASLPLLE